MAKRGRTGSLSPKTFFPKTGDSYDIKGSSEVYECLRQNNIVDKGKTIKYCLLVGTDPNIGYTIFLTFHDQDDPALSEFADLVKTIVRPRSKGPGCIRYSWNRGSQTWIQTEEE